MSRLETPADLNKLREQIVAQRNAKQTWLAVCAGTGCRAYGAEALADSLEEEIEKRGIGRQGGSTADGLPWLLRTRSAGRGPAVRTSAISERS